MGREHTLEFVLCTMGTRGDISPFLALCEELKARGHKATVLTNENWCEDVKSVGAEFYPIADKDPPQSARNDNEFFLDSTLPSFRKSFDFVCKRITDGRDVVLIYRSNMLGMESAAEKFGLGHIKIALQPSAIKSLESPPWPLTRLTQGTFAKLGRYVLVPALYHLVEFIRGHVRQRNNFRREIGLAPHPLGRMGGRTEDYTLMLVPKWFATPPTDWPDNCLCCGFLFFDKKEGDIGIDAFIDKHGPPIVFTPGTGVSDVRSFYSNAEAICRASGLPGLFLSRYAGPDFADETVPILRRQYAELGDVLKRSSLIIHHGGIGTTAQALRAGIPQIIIPDRFDQPDNALRIANLGLGAAVLNTNQPIAIWQQLIRQVMSNDDLSERVVKAANAISANDSLKVACDRIESVAFQHERKKPWQSQSLM